MGNLTRKEKERLRPYGELSCGFANAKTTDQACYGLIDGMQHVFDFPPDFAERAKKVFPSLESMSKPERDLLRLLLLERGMLEGPPPFYHRSSSIQYYNYRPLQEQLDDLNPSLSIRGYNRHEKTLTLAEVVGWGEETQSAELGDEPFQVHVGDRMIPVREGQALSEIWKKICRLEGSLPESRFSDIEQLSQDYARILAGHEGIEKSQRKVRKALADLMSGKSVDECGEGLGPFSLVEYVEMDGLMDFGLIPRANGVFSYELSILDEDRFFETHATPDDPWDYMYLTVAVYCLVVFAKPLETIKLIHKCDECQEYFISETKREQKFCSGKCRSKNYHSKPEYKEKKAKERREMHGWQKRGKRKK